jgi:ribosomal protein S16
VPRNIRLAEAPSHGKAALVYDPRSKGAESYIRLAKEIIERQPAMGALASSEVEAHVAEPIAAEEHKEEAAVEEIAAVTAEMDKSA